MDMLAGSVLLIAWLATLRFFYVGGHVPPVAFAVSVAYPVGHLLLAGVILNALSNSRRVDPPLLLAAIGLLLFAAGDASALYFSALGVDPHLAFAGDEGGEFAGYLLLIVASVANAAVAPERPVAGRPQTRRWQVLIPYSPLILASAVVLANTVVGHDLDTTSAALFAAIVVLVVVRQVIAPVQSQTLLADRELQMKRARDIQRHLLPQDVPLVAGYELAGACVAAQEVGGDFYDWVTRADGCLDVTIADVMGKGMGAALVMAALRTALRTAAPEIGPVERIARAQCALPGGMEEEGLFATMFLGRLDPASGELRYVVAGHGSAP
jgi:hypothetical protein